MHHSIIDKLAGMASFDQRILNGISVLSAIIDSGTLATASEVLNMSPSGVSRSIARLEARLGIRLLERTTRSVSLSPSPFTSDATPPLAVPIGATVAVGQKRALMKASFAATVIAFKIRS